jgi:hypothetical protein
MQDGQGAEEACFLYRKIGLAGTIGEDALWESTMDQGVDNGGVRVEIESIR